MACARWASRETVDEHTLFAIASNTKNVTAAALAMLVDEGKVKWDEPVATYLPGFTLSDPISASTSRCATRSATGPGSASAPATCCSGPTPTGPATRWWRQAAFVPIEDGFRAHYHYCNLMFVVAGRGAGDGLGHEPGRTSSRRASSTASA